jgi:hypothetical protein
LTASQIPTYVGIAVPLLFQADVHHADLLQHLGWPETSASPADLLRHLG